MKCQTRALAYGWWADQLTAEVTAGECMAMAMPPQELMTFDTYPQSRRMNWMHDDDVIAVDSYWWNLKLAPWKDTVVVTDAFYYTMNGQRGFADTVVAQDFIALHVWKTFSDTVSTADDFLVGQRESPVETVSAVDHGVINVQNYFDHAGAPDGYFAADYFGYGYTW